ncbi:MAG: glutamate--tRNA ligase [Rhodobacteraceae bacterium]|nr:glutamate--tRNA ligase [Paracoccaceae bacterium]
MSTPVITRFAPSPTGYLHIGGARTALFNWLYARHNNGKMLLRIEDTDRARSSEDAIDAIIEGLSWLGLEADEEPVFQHTRADRHREAAEILLTSGKAYRCYCTPDELTEMRDKARSEGRAPIYDGRWRDRALSDAPEGTPYAVRFKAPREGNTVIDDMVQGQVTWSNTELDDLILLRSDESPTYMLSVVVDDHDMAITHVIRGDDHLTNAARQAQIFDALGWERPRFAHIPLIHGPDGAKLSKRHGALGVEAYRDMGYLPAAIRNYLVRLGWSHGNDEVFSTTQAIEWFDLDSVGRAAARFDFAKLESINFEHIRNAPDDELLDALTAFMPHHAAGAHMLKQLDTELREKLLFAMPSLKERAKTLNDLVAGAQFLFAKRPLSLDQKAAKLLDDDARQVMSDLVKELEGATDWTLQSVDTALRAFVETRNLKFGKVAQPLRAALTGTTVSPGIFEIMAVLGKEETLARISDQVT